MPEESQDRMIEYIRDDTWSVRHTASSHSPFLSRIEELVGILGVEASHILVGSAGRVEFLVTSTERIAWKIP